LNQLKKKLQKANLKFKKRINPNQIQLLKIKNLGGNFGNKKQLLTRVTAAQANN